MPRSFTKMTKKEEFNYKDDFDKGNSFCQSTVDLKKYLKENVENILKNVSEEKFVQVYKRCYKGFEKRNDLERPALSGSSVEAKSFRTQLNDILVKIISDTIDETVSTMNPNLQELEKLKKEQADSFSVWRPPGDVMQHIMPFEYVCLIEKKKKLEDKIQKEKEALEVLKLRLFQKRNKVKELHENLLSSIDEIKGVVTKKVHQN